VRAAIAAPVTTKKASTRYRGTFRTSAGDGAAVGAFAGLALILSAVGVTA